jgi:hypothetical protein
LIEGNDTVTINHAKSQVHSLGRGPVTITGISLYPDRRLAPSPWLLETARQTFEQTAQLVAAGEIISEDEVARMHGYHGTLHQLSNGETPIVRQLDRAYVQALGITLSSEL